MGGEAVGGNECKLDRGSVTLSDCGTDPLTMRCFLKNEIVTQAMLARLMQAATIEELTRRPLST